MEDYKTFHKYIFHIDNVLCTSFATFENPSKILFKKTISCILIALLFSHSLHVLVSVFACSESCSYPWYATVNILMRNICVVYTLAMGLIDSEEKRTTALTLASIETHLRELNIEVPHNSLETVVACFSGATFVWNQLVTLTKLIFTLRLFDSVLQLYTETVKFSQMFGCLVLLSKCYRIKVAVCHELDIIRPGFLNDSQHVEPGPYIIQRRVAWAEGSELHRRNFNLVRSVESIQSVCHQDVNSFYRMFVVWLSVSSAILAPMVFVTNIGWSHPFYYVVQLNVILHLATNVIVILIVSLLQKVEETYEDKMRALRATSAGEESRREVRHLLLRHVHSSEPYNCYLFDVDFTLLSTIIETTLFVVTTYFS